MFCFAAIKMRAYTTLFPSFRFAFMKRALFAFTLSVGLLGAAASAYWANSQPARSPEAMAQCIAKQLTGPEKEQLGASGAMAGAGQVIRVQRGDFLSCRGKAGLLASSEERTALAGALVRALDDSSDFRRGMQSAAWTRKGYRGAVRDELTALTLLSAHNTLQRVWATGCQKITPDQSDELRDIELPLLTARAGTQGWATSAQAARLLADDIINQAKYHALKGAEAAGQTCSNAMMAAGLARQQEAAAQFLAGTNPAVPGCRVVVEKGEYLLSCGGAPSK